MLRIRQATLLTGQVEPPCDLLIEQGRIVALGVALPPAEVQTTIEAAGWLVAPGFIDLQLNGGFGHDFTAQPETIGRVAAQLPRYGVTAFLPTLISSPPDTITAAQAALSAQRETQGARPLGWHLEGPFLNPARCGAHPPAHVRLPSPAQVANWSPANGVRLVTLAPELPHALETIRALTKQGVVVAAGHSQATYDEAVAGLAVGIRYGTHLFNAMPPLEKRQPGVVGALLQHPITTGLIVDGVHIHPALVALIWRLKAGQLNLVSDGMAALGQPDGRYRLGDHWVQVAEGQARLADGTLAGSVVPLDEAVRRLMAYTGCTLAEAVKTVTAVPARLLGIEHERGHVAVGYAADLVLLDAQGHVQMTLVGGRVAYQRD